MVLASSGSAHWSRKTVFLIRWRMLVAGCKRPGKAWLHKSMWDNPSPWMTSSLPRTLSTKHTHRDRHTDHILAAKGLEGRKLGSLQPSFEALAAVSRRHRKPFFFCFSLSLSQDLLCLSEALSNSLRSTDQELGQPLTVHDLRREGLYYECQAPGDALGTWRQEEPIYVVCLHECIVLLPTSLRRRFQSELLFLSEAHVRTRGFPPSPAFTRLARW